MSAETASKRSLTQLTHEIEQAEAEAARLERERSAVAKDAARAARRLRYLHWARSIRKPRASFEMWPLAVLVFVPLVIGVVLFMLVDLVIGLFGIAFLAFLIGAGAGAAFIASLLHRPADPLLEPAIADAEAKCRLENARLKEKTERLTEANERLQMLVDERRDQIASGKLQRAALLQRPWKSMRPAEWEDFVVEVCRTLGANVERATGGSDAYLIADFGSRRAVILTEGEGHNVASSTIQKALFAKERHRCDACAVIINRRFTGAAQDYAERNGCKAIGAAEFPDFVLGKIDL